MIDRVLTVAVAAFIALLSLTATVFAAGEVLPPDSSLLDLAQPVFHAVMAGQGMLAAALALILVVAAARRYLPQFLPAAGPFIKSDAGSMLSTFLLSLGGAFATAFTAGAALSLGVAKAAFGVAFLAAGGYQGLKHLVAPILRKVQGMLPAKLRPLLDVVLWIFDRRSPAEKAEAAGNAAVAASPATGAAGVVGTPKNFP